MFPSIGSSRFCLWPNNEKLHVNTISQLESPVFVPRLATEGKPWPTHELEWVGGCPLCASIQHTVLYKGLTDRVFYCAPGVWTLYRCHGCEAAYLDPRPTPESIAYDAYYTHAAGRAAPGHMLARLKRALRDGYPNACYRFDLKPSLAWAQWILPC